MKQPTSELVATAWLDTLGLTVDDVGIELPADPTLWAANGFVQVTTVGGTPAIHVPMRQAAIQVDAWCCRPNSEQAPWNRAGSLAGEVVDGCYAQTRPVNITLPAGFREVRVHSTYPLSEPRPIVGDDSRFARYQFDMQMNWSWQS